MTDAQTHFSFGAVILAAGRSTRMGTSKLLLPWGHGSILAHLINQWRNLGAAQIGVVCATGDAPIDEELQRLKFTARNRIENSNPERGMFSSVQCAANWPAWKATLSHWAIILGDQPHLRPKTLNAVLELAAEHHEKVIQPTHAGHLRHPVLLPKPIFHKLRDSSANNLKDFLLNYEAVTVECDDPGLDLDLDRPEDYQQALSLNTDQIRSGQPPQHRP